MWQGGGLAQWSGVCVAGKGACVVGACMAGRHEGMHSQGRGMCGWGVCMAGRGCAWQGACMARGMHVGGCAWQERRPFQRAVRILLKCILVLLKVSLLHCLEQFSLSDK